MGKKNSVLKCFQASRTWAFVKELCVTRLGAGPAGGAVRAALRGSRARRQRRQRLVTPGTPGKGNDGGTTEWRIVATPCRDQTSCVTLQVASQEHCPVCLPAQTHILFLKCILPRDCFQNPVCKCCQDFTCLKCLLGWPRGALSES